jgi:hypothetical protein
LIGGALTVLAGLEMFFSGQLDLGKIHVQVGVEGLQATILPVLLVLVGVLAVLMPAHRVFYGVIGLVVAVYSLVGVNLGGFFVGMLLGTVGGVMIVSWLPADRRRPAGHTDAAPDATTPEFRPDADTAEPPPFPPAAFRGTAEAIDEEPAAEESGGDSGEDPPGGATRGRRSAVRGGALAVTVSLAGCLGMFGVGDAPAASATESSAAPQAVRSGVCVLGILGDCSTPPTPTPPPPSSGIPGVPGIPGTHSIPGTPGVPGTGGTGGVTGTPAPTASPQKATRDPGSTVFTQPSGDLSGTSIGLDGLHYVGLVTVPIAGGRTTALKLVSDKVSIQDFSLVTRARDGHGVKATALTMTLTGHVVVYVNSVSGALDDGTPVQYEPSAPPTPGELLSALVRVHLGLVGVTADTVSYAPSQQLVY